MNNRKTKNRIALLIGFGLPFGLFLYYFIKLLSLVPSPDSIQF